MTTTHEAQNLEENAMPVATPRPPTAARPMVAPEQLPELLSLLEGSDTVELKLTLPTGSMRSAAAALGMDPLNAQVRMVSFFDTPDLDLYKAGIVVRARRIQGKPGDSVIKLRPVVPATLSPELRARAGFGVEVDAMPGGFVCSGRLKRPADNAEIWEAFRGKRPIGKLFGKAQRALYAEHAPAGIELDDLKVLGPLFVLKLKFVAPEIAASMVAELWLYPDGSRIFELSTKCLPSTAFDSAIRLRAFMQERGVELGGEQQAKTRKALRYFSSALPDPAPQ
jgi:hypothetical protein